MTHEAEKYNAEDEAAARISSKNGLESYMQNSMDDEKLANKFDATNELKLEAAVNRMIPWLDASQEVQGRI
jgi:heat shock protein 1/8